ncbi:MAG: DUF4292 domain-containing protein [Thermodesulfobacteriota bacterium]
MATIRRLLDFGGYIAERLRKIKSKLSGYLVLFYRIKRLSFFFFLLPSLLALISCSYLPRGIQISDHEARRIRAEFNDLLASQEIHQRCLDSRVVISLKSTWLTGSLNGYLQIMPPDRLKYVVLDPLGRTQVILLADGDNFHYLSLSEKKSYRGQVKAVDHLSEKPYAKYIPADFPFDRSFYLLTGTIFAGPVEVDRVRRAKNEDGYWLEIKNDAGGRSLILFDDLRQIIRQYIILDRNGERGLKFTYEDYRPRANFKLPGLVSLDSPEHGADIRLRLTDWRELSCSEEQFHYETPGSFESEQWEGESRTQ